MPGCDPDGTLETGDTLTGSLAAADCALLGGRPTDVWTLDLTGGATLSFDLGSDDFDAVLVLADATGIRIAADDDSGPGTDARITATLAAGSYQLWATSYGPGAGGTYRLTATEGVSGALPDRPSGKPSMKLVDPSDLGTRAP